MNALRESRVKSFPYRLGKAFIEVARVACASSLLTTFPYNFVRTFIEEVFL